MRHNILNRIRIRPTASRLVTVLVLAVFAATGFTSTALALDPEQKKVFDDNVLLFNYKVENLQCGGGGLGDIALVGADNVEKAYNYFVARGLSPAQSAGIVGNLIAESGVDPTIAQGGGGPGRGIAQWGVGQRWDTTQGPGGQPGNVVAFAASKGKPPTDLGVQLDFLWHEMSNIPPWTRAMESVKAATTFGQAAVAFLRDFERAKDSAPDGPNARKRTALAGEVLERYGGVIAGGGGNSPVATINDCGGATVDCGGQAVTGKAAILCQARMFDPYGYLWGGGHEDPERFMARWEAGGGFNQPFRQVVDCSGLITVAIWNAFKAKVIFATSNMASNPAFREIPIAQTVPGDFVWRPGHVEIVSEPGANATFGAHTANTAPERQISDAKKQNWSKGYEYVGATQ